MVHSRKKLSAALNSCAYALMLLIAWLPPPVYSESVDTLVYQISTQAHFPPYHWYDNENNKPRGYTHKVMTLLGEQLNFKLKIKENDYSSEVVAKMVVDGMISGDTDIAFAPLFAVPVDEVIVVETPIYFIQTKIFFRKDKPIDYRKWQDLEPYVGGYLDNYAIAGEANFDNYAKQSLTLKRYPSYQHMVKALLGGEVDYLLGMNKPVWFELQLLGERAAVGTADTAITQLDIHLLISKASPLATKAKQVSDLLMSYRNSGRMSTLINKSMLGHLTYRKAAERKVASGAQQSP